jgi:hypothetical protein
MMAKKTTKKTTQAKTQAKTVTKAKKAPAKKVAARKGETPYPRFEKGDLVATKLSRTKKTPATAPTRPQATKATGKVRRPARALKSAVRGALQAQKGRKSAAPGRERRRARAAAQPRAAKAAAPKPIPVARAHDRAPRTVAQVAAAPKDGDTRKGTFLLHRLSGTARAGQWVIEARPQGDMPVVVHAEKPFVRSEKALDAARRLFPNMTRVPSDTDGWGDRSQAAADNKLAQPARVQRTAPRSAKPLAHAHVTPSAVSAVPVMPVADEPYDDPEAGVDLEPGDDPDVALVAATEPTRFMPPPVTRDTDIVVGWPLPPPHYDESGDDDE